MMLQIGKSPLERGEHNKCVKAPPSSSIDEVPTDLQLREVPFPMPTSTTSKPFNGNRSFEKYHAFHPNP